MWQLALFVEAAKINSAKRADDNCFWRNREDRESERDEERKKKKEGERERGREKTGEYEGRQIERELKFWHAI